jgi:hypothetical protein
MPVRNSREFKDDKPWDMNYYGNLNIWARGGRVLK